MDGSRSITILSPGDVSGIRLMCSKCPASFSFPPNRVAHLPNRCPSCNADWTQSINITNGFATMVNAIESWMAMQEAAKFRVFLEVPSLVDEPRA